MLSPPLSQALAGASRVVARVLGGESLTAALDEDVPGASRAAAHDLAYGTLRDYGGPELILAALARKPIPDRIVRALLLVALHALRHERRAPHTVVNEAVTATAVLGAAAARGLVNAVLRNYLRRREALETDARRSEPACWSHPQWWIECVRRAYPDAWQDVLAAGNARPPLTLRVNRRRLSVDAYLARLAAQGVDARRVGAFAVRLARPRGVEGLPGFAEGDVSVQDAGAQLAAPLLDVHDGMRVLDACAAPGGKTAHLLELAAASVVAIDRDAERLTRVAANLERLGLSAAVRVADAGELATWWDGKPFDRVLLDAPCSASGVVRRHPDIKWLRREQDLAAFAREQSRLLDALWRVLGRDGKLLYATCSVFPEENDGVVDGFLARHPGARRLPVPGLGDGQLLPDDDHDGFFYALLQRDQQLDAPRSATR
jgi:16S rRNA (cytosine967-C5)-methyltransferase